MKLIDKDYLIQYLTGMADAECCDDNTERIIKKYIIPHINTLEVKEVDLNVEEELKKYGISSPKTKDVCIASHFYELGLKAQKGE